MNILLIGKSKSGKTRSLETLPRGVVLFSFDIGGYHCLRKKKTIVVNRLADWMKGSDTLKADECLVVDYSVEDKIGEREFVKVDKMLIQNFIQDANLLWDPKLNERGIYHAAVDSLTSFQRPVLEYVVSFSSRLEPSQRDWGLAVNKINEIVSSLVANHNVDFTLIAHTQVDKDEMSGRIEENLLVFGKQLPNQLLAMFDDIFLAQVESMTGKMEYSWTVQPTGLLKCIGSRNFDDLPPKFPQDFAKLYGEKLRGGK